MAQYFTNFDEYPVGDVTTSGQTDWTPKISNGTSDYRILDGGDQDGKFLRVQAVSTNGSRVLAYNPLNGVGDNIETLVKFWIFKSGADGSVGRFGAAYTRYGGTTEAGTIGYAVGFIPASSVKSLALFEDSTGIAQFQNYSWSMNTDYFVRTRISGTLRQVKIWPAASAEPGAWTFESNGALPTIANPYSGVGTYQGDSYLYVKQYSAATVGDTAPATAQQYQNYLNSLVPSSTPIVGFGGGYGGVGGYGVSYGGALRASTKTTSVTQNGNAAIQRVLPVSQTGNARIQNSVSRDQISRAVIQNSTTRSQLANARLQRSEIKNQFATARIARQELRSQYAIARIQALATRSQSGAAVISIVTTKTQPASARIAELGTVALQSGIARITAQTARTQSANARIQKSATKTTIGNARIQKSITNTQTAIASIRKDTPQTQTGSAAIFQGILRDQSAVARILRIMSATQPGNARIQRSVTQSVIGNARIRIFVLRNQLANSAILRIPQQHQPARGLIAKEMITTQPGGAFIIRVNEYQNPPRIGTRPQIGGRPSTIRQRPHTDIDVAISRTGRVAERPRVDIVNTRPRARQ